MCIKGVAFTVHKPTLHLTTPHLGNILLLTQELELFHSGLRRDEGVVKSAKRIIRFYTKNNSYINTVHTQIIWRAFMAWKMHWPYICNTKILKDLPFKCLLMNAVLLLRQRFSTSSNYPVTHPIPAYHYHPQYYFLPLSLYRHHPTFTTTTIPNTELDPWHLLLVVWLLSVLRLLPGTLLPRLSPIFSNVANICYCRLRYWVLVEAEQNNNFHLGCTTDSWTWLSIYFRASW